MPKRRRRVSRLSLFYFFVTAGLLVGGSIWLDRRGELATARVTSKNEEITVQRVPQGGWFRWHRLGVEFDTRDGATGMATVTVPEERYDAIHPGDTILVRYVPFFPLLARAADRSTGLAMRDAATHFGADLFLTRLILWLAAGAVALWVASRIGTPLVVVVGLAWIAVAFPLQFPSPPPLRPLGVEGSARVTSVTLITKAPARRTARRRRAGRGFGESTRRLAMPYQVVQLRFTLPGQQDSIVAVDAVDSASVAGLVVGEVLAIRYDPLAPREARLSEGTRTFRERNRYHFAVPVIGVGVLGMLAAWGASRRRRTRGATAPASDVAPDAPWATRER
ncbi:MAG TPA: hypothetical protein VEB59_14185 [Gemmatimonadales bacterium]|nr:hypothetical protein [Gemmatimonadales bacterium]